VAGGKGLLADFQLAAELDPSSGGGVPSALGKALVGPLQHLGHLDPHPLPGHLPLRIRGEGGCGSGTVGPWGSCAWSRWGRHMCPYSRTVVKAAEIR